MTFTTAALGSLSGLFIGVFSNGVRKLPLFRRPWDHLILMGIMGYGGHKYPQLEDATLERVNAMRAARTSRAARALRAPGLSERNTAHALVFRYS